MLGPYIGSEGVFRIVQPRNDSLDQVLGHYIGSEGVFRIVQPRNDSLEQVLLFFRDHLETASNREKLFNQRTNGPANAHLISWPSKAQNIQNLENIW